MGILGSQPERNYYRVSHNELDGFLEDAAKLAKKYSISLEAVIEAKRVLEMARQNDISVQAGDYTDEQASGFGAILSRIAEVLENKE